MYDDLIHYIGADARRPALEGYAPGFRDAEPALCWRLLEGDFSHTPFCCILPRGHDGGVHEPGGDPVGDGQRTMTRLSERLEYAIETHRLSLELYRYIFPPWRWPEWRRRRRELRERLAVQRSWRDA